MTQLLLWLLGIYRRFVSPLTGGACRFEPSCSRYAELCWKYHTAGRGSWLVCKRLLRCHPLCPGGIDLPPLPDHADPADREPDYERLVAKLDRLTTAPRWPSQTPSWRMRVGAIQNACHRWWSRLGG